MTKLDKIEGIINDLQNKKIRIFYFCGASSNLSDSTIFAYNMVKTFREKGIDANILYENKNYMSVEYTLGLEYANLPHFSFDDLRIKNITIKPTDYFFIPETYANFAKELTKNKLPSANIIVCNSHKNIFNGLNLREQWSYTTFFNEPSVNAATVVITDNSLKHVIEENTINENINLVTQKLFDFKPTKVISKKPYVSILCTNPTDYKFIVNSFYNKYPHLGWISFKQVVFSTVAELEETIHNSFVCVWVDNYSEFTLFPLQAMKSATPVVGKIPELIPSWLINDKNIAENGYWSHDIFAIPDILNNVILMNFENEIPNSLYNNMANTVKMFSEEIISEEIDNTIDSIIKNRIKIFELLKTKTINDEININSTDTQD